MPPWLEKLRPVYETMPMEYREERKKPESVDGEVVYCHLPPGRVEYDADGHRTPARNTSALSDDSNPREPKVPILACGDR